MPLREKRLRGKRTGWKLLPRPLPHLKCLPATTTTTTTSAEAVAEALTEALAESLAKHNPRRSPLGMQTMLSVFLLR